MAELDPLTDGVTALLQAAETAARTPQAAATLADARRRLAQPLRVAVAGKVKAGKSTLLNAISATNPQRRSRMPASAPRSSPWYREGEFLSSGDSPIRSPVQGGSFVRRSRDAGRSEVDLGVVAAEVDRLEAKLAEPPPGRAHGHRHAGLSSVSTDVSARTPARWPPLTAAPVSRRRDVPDEARPRERRTLPRGVPRRRARPRHPMDAIGVLARVDEIGSCRLNADARPGDRIAERYQADPRRRRAVPARRPGFRAVGLRGETPREAEYRAARPPRRRPRRGASTACCSPPTGSSAACIRAVRRPGALPPARQARALRGAVRGRARPDGATRATRPLSARSWCATAAFPALRAVLLAQFTPRRADPQGPLGTRGAARRVIDRPASGSPRAGVASGSRRSSRSAHAFVEVRLLTQLRAGTVDLADRPASLSWSGCSARSATTRASRLGLPADTPPAQLCAAAARGRPRTMAAPRCPPVARREGMPSTPTRVVVRSLEGAALLSNCDARSGLTRSVRAARSSNASSLAPPPNAARVRSPSPAPALRGPDRGSASASSTPGR